MNSDIEIQRRRLSGIVLQFDDGTSLTVDLDRIKEFEQIIEFESETKKTLNQIYDAGQPTGRFRLAFKLVAKTLWSS